MKASELFREYIWLIETLSLFDGVTLEEINDEWVLTEMSGGVEMARSTFNRHRDAIADIFGIFIDCDRSNGYVYYISNMGAMRNNTIQSWMLSTLKISNRIHESKSLYKRVLLEDVPTDYGKLDIIMNGMKKNVRLKIAYRKYDIMATMPKVVIEPYCVKMFHNRWYVLGRLHREINGKRTTSFSLFSLDKIVWVMLTDEKFTLPEDFDAREYFANYFGSIIFDGTKPETVVLRAYGREAREMELRALHHSQEKLRQNDEYSDFKYYLCPTTDFRDYIIGRGSRLKVLSPKWLADEIRYKHQEAADAYEKSENNL